jgi:hypothetical protein
MTDPSARSQRLAQIEALQAQGASLLAASKDEMMKTRTRLAITDLEEARGWLNQDNADLRHHITQIVDDAIVRATRHLAIVAKALDDQGFDEKATG